MPEFANPFSVLQSDRKLTHQELIRAIRLMISAEYEAIQLYMRLADSIDHELAKRFLWTLLTKKESMLASFSGFSKSLTRTKQSFTRKDDRKLRTNFYPDI